MKKALALIALCFVIGCVIAQDIDVYITATGTKYHLSTCRTLRDSRIAIPLSEAVKNYDACGICKPPAGPARFPYDLEGKVVGVSDGDTITLLVEFRPHKIRMNGIDAPESGQAFGQVAKEALADLVFGRDVRISVVDIDRYGRLVGDVYAGDLYVNAELVQAGLAWHYVEYSDNATLAALEIMAKDTRAGLWQDPSPVAPWDFRR
jgi:endonuclease YncB( thermonuclease family)